MTVQLNVSFHLINKMTLGFKIENSFWSSFFILAVELKFGPHVFSKYRISMHFIFKCFSLNAAHCMLWELDCCVELGRSMIEPLEVYK